MGQFKVEVTDKAEKDLVKHFKSGNIATIKKIEKLFIELSEHPIWEPDSLNNSGIIFWAIGQEG